jgi:hypothetical protein
MDSSIVEPGRFYSDDCQKTKLNWFCYEFASEVVSHIGRRLQKRLHKKGLTDVGIADFAVRYSKGFKVLIEQKLAGEFDRMPLNYQDIERLLPHVGDKLVDDLLTVAARAWDSLLKVCSVCPTRCISERHLRMPQFDEPPE